MAKKTVTSKNAILKVFTVMVILLVSNHQIQLMNVSVPVKTLMVVNITPTSQTKHVFLLRTVFL